MNQFPLLISFLFLLVEHGLACPHHDVDTNQSFLERNQPRSCPSSRRWALVNVRVFDGEHITEPQTISIDGSHIALPFSPGDAYTEVEAGGRVLIPGLMDSHIHVSNVAGLEQMASYGITTGFNMACINYTQCEALQSLIRSPEGVGLPDLLTAGYPAMGPGSRHAQMLNSTPGQVVHETDDPELVVRYAFGNGSDYFKITAEASGPSTRMQQALVAETGKLGKMTMTHAVELAYFIQAIDSRTTGIQHIPRDAKLNATLIARARSNVEFITPTMNIFRLGVENPGLGQIIGNLTEQNYNIIKENVIQLHRSGLPVLAGTDAVGVFRTATGNVSLPFGQTLHWEMKNLVEAGLTPVQALRAATMVPAGMFGLKDRGRIAPGMRADMVLLDGNPLKNISDTQKIRSVWIGGVGVR